MSTHFAGRILEIDSVVALRCAELMLGETPPRFDALIAATALVHNLTVVTRNVCDFSRFGVPLLNPFTD